MHELINTVVNYTGICVLRERVQIFLCSSDRELGCDRELVCSVYVNGLFKGEE